MTSTIIPAAIEEAAAFVALATANAAEADHALTEARAVRQRVADRVAALEDERAAIQDRRRSGKGEDDTDGSRLALISSDLADLATMLAEADQAILPVQRAAGEARSAVSAAERELAHERDEELLRRLKARADQLAALLDETVGTIEQHRARRRSGRPLWAPPRNLADVLRKLDLTRV